MSDNVREAVDWNSIAADAARFGRGGASIVAKRAREREAELLAALAAPSSESPAATGSGAATGRVDRPEVVCLCGSTRFIDTFMEQYGRLTDDGKIVLTVGRVVPQSEQALGSPRKAALDTLHLRKIDLADRVLVLNVGGYVGPSTRREIAYAKEHGKPIDLLYPDAGLDGPAPGAATGPRDEAVVAWAIVNECGTMRLVSDCEAEVRADFETFDYAKKGYRVVALVPQHKEPAT